MGYRLAWRLTSTPGRGPFSHSSFRRNDHPNELLPPQGHHNGGCHGPRNSMETPLLGCGEHPKYPADCRERRCGPEQCCGTASSPAVLGAMLPPRGHHRHRPAANADNCMFFFVVAPTYFSMIRKTVASALYHLHNALRASVLLMAGEGSGPRLANLPSPPTSVSATNPDR